MKVRDVQHDALRHMLWRKHLASQALDGHLPEILATDGRALRRLLSQERQLVFQQFEDQGAAASLMERVEGSVSPGVALAGYSMFKDHDALAILHTGQGQAPGWLAFPDAARGQVRWDKPTLPARASDLPRARLVAGAGVFWRQRRMVIHVAFEERGEPQRDARGLPLTLLDHIEQVSLHALITRQGQLRALELTDPEPLSALTRVRADRAELSFIVEPAIYREFKQLDGRIWIKALFDRSLFCLPAAWRAAWLTADLQEVEGLSP